MTDEEKLQRMQGAFDRLSRRQRDVFAAIRFDGMTYAEVAERTGYSVRRVEGIMARVICILSRAADGYGDPWHRRLLAYVWARLCGVGRHR